MENTQKQTPKKLGAVGAILGFLFVGFLIYSAFSIATWANHDSGTPSTESAKTDRDLSTEAYVISQGYVKRILKAPATADFPLLDYTAKKTDGAQIYTVHGYVDADNSFGAKIRSYWDTLLMYKGGDPADSASWVLDTLVFDNKVVYEAAMASTTP